MASDSNPSQPRGGLSLYANLLDPNASSSGATISRAPVTSTQLSEDHQDGSSSAAAARKQQQLNAAALRFQPTKRPQLSAQKANKPKSTIVKAPVPTPNGPIANTENINSSNGPVSAPVSTAATAFKTSLADWTANDEEEYYFQNGGEKRQRGGRKKRKKNKDKDDAATMIQNWDDIYDPSRPNNYEDYKHSEEKYREIREWKDKLYAHRMRSQRRRYSSDDSDRKSEEDMRPRKAFAPPASYSFAPPPPPSAFDQDSEDIAPPPPPSPPPPHPTVNVPDDATGEDAYARRMRLSQAVPPPPPPPPPPPTTEPAGTISRAPVLYSLPPAPEDIPATEAELEEALLQAESEGDTVDGSLESNAIESARTEEHRSLRPGQKGFAARLMSKYGWTKGSGLGAAGTGIVNPLRVQVEKRKKKSDAEGGGFVSGSSAAKGKIIGSKTGGTDSVNSSEPAVQLSTVVVLRGMLSNIHLDAHDADARGALMQEIGDECSDKYGRVERVFIHTTEQEAVEKGPKVFVKFTSTLSALRAVQALQGRLFNGNTIEADYWDADKFEEGVL